MHYLITDTSILVDLERLGLLQKAGSLNHSLHIVDIVLRVECPYLEASLLQQRFKIESLSGAELQEALRIEEITGKISVYDAMSYVFAREREMLLATGDGPLRSLALKTEVKFIGLLWFIKEMFNQNIISADIASQAMAAIKADKRFRIPGHNVDEVFKELGLYI